MDEKLFSLRFDIDSLADIEIGVPMLLDLAREMDVRFTFFLNMGKSFNWRTALRGRALSPRGGRSVKTVGRLGLIRTIRTVAINPDIGPSHKKILFKLMDDGHELGLHGGTDHPLWQWRLESMSKNEIRGLLNPAYDRFVRFFGRPEGFTSPGFNYNRYVLELMDEFGFRYASDMEGEEPFRPEGFEHLQVPVNIRGEAGKPFLEYFCSVGYCLDDIISMCTGEIFKRETAVIYGHPAFKPNAPSFRKIIGKVLEEGYNVVLMKDLLKATSGE